MNMGEMDFPHLLLVYGLLSVFPHMILSHLGDSVDGAFDEVKSRPDAVGLRGRG